MTFLSEASETMAGHILTTCISCMSGISKRPTEFIYLAFQSEILQNSQTHQALPGQKVRTNRYESQIFRCIEVLQNNKFIVIDKAIVFN